MTLTAVELASVVTQSAGPPLCQLCRTVPTLEVLLHQAQLGADGHEECPVVILGRLSLLGVNTGQEHPDTFPPDLGETLRVHQERTVLGHKTVRISILHCLLIITLQV